jgi:hypothetical protein
VSTTLWARITSGPASRASLEVAVPLYVAEVSVYEPSLPVQLRELAFATEVAVNVAVACCVLCARRSAATAAPAARSATDASAAAVANLFLDIVPPGFGDSRT